MSKTSKITQIENDINYVFENVLKSKKFKAPEISIVSKFFLYQILDKVKTVPSEYKNKIVKNINKLSKVNDKALKELKNKIPKKYHIYDLHSGNMGIPNVTDSDIDFTIPVSNSKEQKNLIEELKKIDYKFDQKYKESGWEGKAPVDWLSYHKFVDGIEIEVKLRYYKIVGDVMIAHKGIRDNLNKHDKIKVAYIKSILKEKKSEYYKKFKNMLYTAMFNGHPKSFVLGI
jgi:hypothetical protein